MHSFPHGSVEVTLFTADALTSALTNKSLVCVQQVPRFEEESRQIVKLMMEEKKEYQVGRKSWYFNF